MDDAAWALILSWTVVLRRTLGCAAKLVIYHPMFQRWPAALSCGYWLKEWDQGHERTSQVFWGGLSLRESSWRSDVWDQPLQVVPASHLDISCQTSPFGDLLESDPNRYRIHWREYIYISSPGKTCVFSRKSWTVSPMWEKDVQRCLCELISEVEEIRHKNINVNVLQLHVKHSVLQNIRESA